jgi:uncharacterized protein (DUF1330 family)
MQTLEKNGGGHLRCGNTLKKLEKMEKYGPNAKVAVLDIEGKAQGELQMFADTYKNIVQERNKKAETELFVAFKT